MTRYRVVVSVKKVVVVMAEIPAAVGAELSGGFTASFLMFLEFGGASKPTDIADFQLLAGLHSNASR